MWKWIENNAILFISFMGALASAAGTLIHIYWKIKMNSFSIEQMWKKHHVYTQFWAAPFAPCGAQKYRVTHYYAAKFAV